VSNITITNSDDFEKIIQKIETSRKNIVDIFNEDSQNMENINATDVWTGKAQDSLYRKYKELEKNFSPIDETLQIYVSFLNNALNSYKQLEQKTINNMDINNQSLDVNS